MTIIAAFSNFQEFIGKKPTRKLIKLDLKLLDIFMTGYIHTCSISNTLYLDFHKSLEKKNVEKSDFNYLILWTKDQGRNSAPVPMQIR